MAATQIDHSWVAVDKIPVIREKLYDVSTGEERPGNRLEVKLSDKLTVLDEDEKEIVIRRISVVLPNGTEQETKYYIIVQPDAEEDDKVITETWLQCTVDSQDVYYAAQIHESGKFTVDVDTTAEETPEEFYILTDTVIMTEEEKFYEQVQKNGTEEVINGAEMFVISKQRPEYKHLTNNIPDMITPEEGDPYTAWVQKWNVANDHNEAVYSEELKLEDLEQITINQVIYDQVIPYTVQTTDAVYPWTFYPAGDFYLIDQNGCETAAENLTKTDYTCKGAALFGNILNVYFVSAAEAEGYAAVYIMDGDDRISMVIGKPGDEVELPEELKKLGWEFKGYEAPVPTVFTAAAQSVNTIWQKIDDSEEDDKTPKRKATWTVPNKHWSYSINVEVGADVPAAPNPAIDNISITSWTLKSEPFADNKMPDYDIEFEAVYTETTPIQTPKHNLVYQIQYTTEDDQSHTDTYKTYQITEGAAITPEPAPYKRGGTFQGWQNLPAYMPQNDVTVTGTFSGKVKNSIIITYYVDGQVHTTQTYTPGDSVTAPANPTQSGKVFSGWIGVPQTAPTYNMEVQGYFYDAESTDVVTIKYVVDNQTYKTYKMQKGAALPEEPAPIKTGYTFSGWSPVLTVVPNVDTTISGTFTADAPSATKYDLKFYLQDSSQLHSTLYAQFKLAAGETIVAPQCDVEGFQGWQNVPQTMPAQNLNIYGIASGDTLDYAVNVTYEYTNADGTKTNVKGNSYLLEVGAEFIYPAHTPDQAHADYFWKGWTGDEYIYNGRMPAKEVNLIGHFMSPDVNGGTVDGYARIEWRLPNHDPNGLNHDPYDVYKFEYVPFGQPLVAPTNVPNYTGRDGNQYQFQSWGTYPATAPSSTAVVQINGTSTRVAQQFEVKYYLYRYELGAADAVKFLYKTEKVYPGTSMATIHTQVANEIATDYPGYLFKGQWFQQSFYADEDTMGWFDRAYYSHIYSPEYAEQTGVTIAGYHKVYYKTHSYAPGLAPTYTPYIDGVAVYQVAATKWVAEGASFTDPTGPFTAPFPHGSEFTFAGWQEHETTIGNSDITVWASWQYITYPCEITWIIKKIDENGNETQITHAVTVQQQGFALQWPADPTVPENYVWAGWDVYTYQGFTNLVWREAVHTVYGKMVHVNSGECPSGFAFAKYLLKTHDTKYPPQKYITHETIIAPINGEIPASTSVPADWQGLDGNTYHFIEWVYPQNKMPYYSGGVLEIVAKDSKVSVEKTFTLELWMQGNGHNEREDWATIQVYPGTNLEQVVTDYIAEHGDPAKNGFVWSGIWRCDFDEMPERDCKATTIMWEEQYFIETHPDSDEYFIIEWVSPYWKGYWRPQDRWTIKTEVKKQGTLITPPENPEMTGGHANEYNFIGWTGLPADNVMPRRNLTITANWEEATVTAYVIWNMAIPQQDGTVSYLEYVRREIDMSTAQYTGAEAPIGRWPSNPVSDQNMEFVQWCRPYQETQTPSQWLPMAPADDYSIAYDPTNQTQEYLVGTALMQSLTWDGGRLTGYSRVYWRRPTLIKHHTGYIEYEWTTWKFFYVKNGYPIMAPTETPPNVFDFEGVENQFVEWPSHAVTADGTDITINAVYDRLAVRYTIRYFAKYYDRNGVTPYNPSTKLLLTCHAFGGAFIDILPKSDPEGWEFHYHRQNVPVGSHFWAVINDGSGAPLFTTWDGTCLYRNMDLCAELWLTGDEHTDYVPEEDVDLVEWPDGDDMDHSGSGPEPGQTINCTYFIGNTTYIVKSYSDGTAFDNLSESSINYWLQNNGYENYYYDGWEGAPASGIVYAEDYPSGSFSVTLKMKYVSPIVQCTYVVNGKDFAIKNYNNGEDFVPNITCNINSTGNPYGSTIASYISTSNVIGSYSWSGAPASGKVYKDNYPTRNFVVNINWSEVNWKAHNTTLKTRKFLTNYSVSSAKSYAPTESEVNTWLTNNNYQEAFTSWSGYPSSFVNSSYNITAQTRSIEYVNMEMYYISPTGTRTSVGSIRMLKESSRDYAVSEANAYTVDTSSISWWQSNLSPATSWTFSSTTFSGSQVPTYAEKQCVKVNNVQLFRIKCALNTNEYVSYTAHSLTEINSCISNMQSIYPSGKSNTTLTSKVYVYPSGYAGSPSKPFAYVTEHTAASAMQSFDANTTYMFVQYVINEDTDFVNAYNGKYPPDFHYVKAYGNADDIRVLLYNKWHLTGSTLPSSYNNTEVVGYNKTVSSSTTSIARDCSTNDNVFNLELTIGKNGTLLQQTGTMTSSSVSYITLNTYSYFVQQDSDTMDVSMTIPVASSSVSASVIRSYLKRYAQKNGITPEVWDNSEPKIYYMPSSSWVELSDEDKVTVRDQQFKIGYVKFDDYARHDHENMTWVPHDSDKLYAPKRITLTTSYYLYNVETGQTTLYETRTFRPTRTSTDDWHSKFNTTAKNWNFGSTSQSYFDASYYYCHALSSVVPVYSTAYKSYSSLREVFQNYYNGQSLTSSATADIEMYAYPIAVTRDSVSGNIGTIKITVDLSNKSADTNYNIAKKLKVYYTTNGSAPTTSSSYFSVTLLSGNDNTSTAVYGGTFTITGYDLHCTVKARSFREEAILFGYNQQTGQNVYLTPGNHWCKTTASLEYYSKLSAPTFSFNSGNTKLTVQANSVADSLYSAVQRNMTSLYYSNGTGHWHENDTSGEHWDDIWLTNNGKIVSLSSTANKKIEFTADNTKWPTLVATFDNTTASTNKIGRWRKMLISARATSSLYITSEWARYTIYVYSTYYTGDSPTAKSGLVWNNTAQELVNQSLTAYAWLDATTNEINLVLNSYTDKSATIYVDTLFFEDNTYDYKFSIDNGTSWTSTVPSQTEPGTYVIKYKHNALSETNVLLPTSYYNQVSINGFIDRANIQSLLDKQPSASALSATYDGSSKIIGSFNSYDKNVYTIKYKTLFGRRIVPWGNPDTTSLATDPTINAPTSTSGFTNLTSLYIRGTEAGLYKIYYTVTVVDTTHYYPAASNNIHYLGYCRIFRIGMSIDSQPSDKTTPPMIYDGNPQEVITGAMLSGGIPIYREYDGSGSLPSDLGNYITTVPTATIPGRYEWLWAGLPDDNHYWGRTWAGPRTGIINRRQATVSVAPSPIQNLQYTGQPQVLHTEGTAVNGHMEYAPRTSGTQNVGTWQTTPISQTNPGEYGVWYKAVGDDAYTDSSDSQLISCSITRPANRMIVAPTPISGLVYDGYSHYLCTAGQAEYGTVVYAQGSSKFYQSIPMKSGAYNYPVQYKVDASTGYDGIPETTIYCSIAKAPTAFAIKPTPVTGLVYDINRSYQLVNEGTALNNWTIKYVRGTADGPSSGNYGSSNIRGDNAGDYYVWYKAFNNYNAISTSNCDEVEGYVVTTIAQAPCEFYPENIRWVTQLTYNGQDQDFLEDAEVPGTEVVPSKYGSWSNNVYLSYDQQNWYRAGYEGNDMLYASERGTYHIYYKLVPANTNYAESEVYDVTITIS